MKVLVKYTECISEHHQGGYGQVFERHSIIHVDDHIIVEDLFDYVKDILKESSPIFYKSDDRESLTVRSIEIFY